MRSLGVTIMLVGKSDCEECGDCSISLMINDLVVAVAQLHDCENDCSESDADLVTFN
jgi:hypothetical protein